MAPQSIDDIVEQFACRVLAQLGLPQEKQYRVAEAALQSSAGLAISRNRFRHEQKPNPNRARNDQVRALRVCAAVRAGGRASGGARGRRLASLGGKFFWIIVAMVGARSAAMTMNRIADIEYDRRNPRTANRALPAGELSVGFAWAFTAACVASAGFGRVAIESAGAEAFAAGAGNSVFLFLHEALHQLGRILCSGFAWAFRPPPRGLPFAARSIGAC